MDSKQFNSGGVVKLFPKKKKKWGNSLWSGISAL